MNELYRNAAKPVESSFVFDDKALKTALKRIYEKDFNPITEIEENLFNEVWSKFNEATDKGFGQRTPDDPDYDFYQELKYNNGVFSAFKVHRAQNDMAAQLLRPDGTLKSFQEWEKDVYSIATHHVSNWLQTEYDTAIIRAHQAADWKQFEREKDILPNLKWMPSTSLTPGKDHKIFWGTILPIDHPFWNKHRPGDRWNCKCTLSSTDEKPTRVPGGGENPPDGLGGNPGKTGELFDESHPYRKNAYKGAEKAVKKAMKEAFSKKMPAELKPDGEYLKDKKIKFKKEFFDLIDDTPGKDVRFKIDQNGSGSYYMPDTEYVREGRSVKPVPEPMRRMVHIAENNRNKASDWHRESVVYHEFGHAIDAQRKLYLSPELKGLMAKHTKRLRTKKEYSVSQSYFDYNTNTFKSDKVNVKMSQFEYVDKKLKELYSRVYRMETETFTKRGITKQDVYEQIGSTRDAIMSLDIRYGAGHSKAYFKIPGMSEKEFIAHCFENAFAENKVFKKYLPELYDEMVRYVNELSK